MIRVGGMALRNGIIFVSEHKKATGLIDSNGEINISVEDLAVVTNTVFDDIKYYIYKIPLIRGLYDMFKGKSILIVIVIFQILSYLLKYITENNSIKNSNPAKYMFFSLIEIMLYIIFTVIIVKGLINIIKYIIKDIIELKDVFSFHGAEHKAINTLRDNRELSIDEIKKSSRISYRCGSNLLVFWIFLIIIFTFILKADLYIIWILSYSIAYELFSIKNGEKVFFISLFYKLAGMLQEKIITIEPSEKQIELAALTLKELIKAEVEELI